MSPCSRYQVKLLSATNSKVSVEGEREFCYSRASFFWKLAAAHILFLVHKLTSSLLFIVVVVVVVVFFSIHLKGPEFSESGTSSRVPLTSRQLQ